MNPSGVPWQTIIFTGEVFGGQCAYCNETLSAAALSRNLHQEHAGHIPSVALWVRVLAPDGYRGLELQLRAEFFIGQKRPILDCPLHVPAIVLRLYCNSCWAEKSPTSDDDVLNFRSQHGEHLKALKIHTVLLNFVGRALQQNISVIGHCSPYSPGIGQAMLSPDFAVRRAEKLNHIARPLHCTITGVRCNACKSRFLINRSSEIANELSLHRCHWESVHLHVKVREPKDYAGRELEVRAFPFSLASLASPDGAIINCVLIKLFRQHGGLSIMPSNAFEVSNYIEAAEGRHNQPRFLALVRGQGDRIFQCDFPVIHVHAPSRSFPKVSRFNEVQENA